MISRVEKSSVPNGALLFSVMRHDPSPPQLKISLKSQAGENFLSWCFY
jgi:hypothetical protein